MGSKQLELRVGVKRAVGTDTDLPHGSPVAERPQVDITSKLWLIETVTHHSG